MGGWYPFTDYDFFCDSSLSLSDSLLTEEPSYVAFPLGIFHLERMQNFLKTIIFLPRNALALVGIKGLEKLVFRKKIAYVLNEWSLMTNSF